MGKKVKKTIILKSVREGEKRCRQCGVTVLFGWYRCPKCNAVDWETVKQRRIEEFEVEENEGDTEEGI